MRYKQTVIYNIPIDKRGMAATNTSVHSSAGTAPSSRWRNSFKARGKIWSVTAFVCSNLKFWRDYYNLQSSRAQKSTYFSFSKFSKARAAATWYSLSVFGAIFYRNIKY